MRFAVAVLVALFVSPSALADSLATRDEAVALTSEVIAHISRGEVREGLDLAKPYTVIPESEFESLVGQLELQAPVMLSRFGKSIGYELLRDESAGESLVQVVYLQRFEKHAGVWRFFLYKGVDGWVVNSFTFVDTLSSAF